MAVADFFKPSGSKLGGLGSAGAALGSMGSMLGLSALGPIGLAIAGVGMVGSIYGSIKGGALERQQMKLANEEARVDASARGLQRSEALKDITGQQIAMAEARGVAGGSSIFRQVSQKSFESFKKDQEAEALGLSFKEMDLQKKLSASRVGEFADILSNVGKFALAGAGSPGSFF